MDMSEIDLTYVDEVIARCGGGPEQAIPILQALQEHYRYLPAEAMRRVCETTRITPAGLAGVAGFYGQFRQKPVGKHIIRICHGTACHVKGASRVHDALRRALDLRDGQDTDGQGRFTLEKVACLGCCTLAPVVQIDNVTYGHLTPSTAAGVLDDFLALRKHPAAVGAAEEFSGGAAGEIRIGLGSCCVARGSEQVLGALEKAVRETGRRVAVKQVGCVGMCHQTPLVEVVEADGRSFLYARLTAEDAGDVVRRHFSARGLRKLHACVSTALEKVLTDEAWQPTQRLELDPRRQAVADFLSPQKHVATESCGQVDPLDIDDAIRRGGFEALRQAQSLSPREIIRRIGASGLRGRGGAGYHTALKWAAVHAAPGRPKYVIINADEGDPGAFMDRMILESYPYRVIEGVAIAARAVEANEAIFYIRAEYSLAVRRVNAALDVCRRRGVLGAGSPGALDIRVMEGAGAFVCGEETALIASLEGRRGTPRLRPPYPSQAGLHGRPTLVNNVETYALVPWIIRRGPEEFAAMGTASSKGTKVFALAGKVARGGLIEVPMGVSLRQIVMEIGGGVAGGKAFKAAQVGGPSGGCVPAALADVPVDYEALAAAGAIMGSGGLIVLDEDDCMVEMARYFLRFTQDQSCGRCTFCRIGTRRMLDILERLCAGQAHSGDVEQLEALAGQVRAGSLCGLGKTAPNPVLSTLRHFRDEYEAHAQGRCPAGRCTALIHYTITDECIGCTLCAQNCPVAAIAPTPYEKHSIDNATCVRCGVCKTVCPAKAVVIH